MAMTIGRRETDLAQTLFGPATPARTLPSRPQTFLTPPRPPVGALAPPAKKKKPSTTGVTGVTTRPVRVGLFGGY
jgi:hypothetical protein